MRQNRITTTLSQTETKPIEKESLFYTARQRERYASQNKTTTMCIIVATPENEGDFNPVNTQVIVISIYSSPQKKNPSEKGDLKNLNRLQ